jgi:RNA polymerase sigma-70 factor (ECF subfamily)
MDAVDGRRSGYNGHAAMTPGGRTDRPGRPILGADAMAQTVPEPSRAWRFPTTQWSCIVQAGSGDEERAREALARLCNGYWYPLYAFVRRRGHDSDAAMDLVQGYFARLLEKGVLAAADPTRGRFRSFLRTDCSHFLSHHRAHYAAQKRGGGQRAVSIDARDAEGRFLREPADDLTPERLFERAWAMTLLERVVALLREEYEAAGRAVAFDRLKPVLLGGGIEVSYAQLAAEWSSTEAAVQKAVYRLRRRYAALLREQIAATVADPSEIEDEIRDLFTALAP